MDEKRWILSVHPDLPDTAVAVFISYGRITDNVWLSCFDDMTYVSIFAFGRELVREISKGTFNRLWFLTRDRTFLRRWYVERDFDQDTDWILDIPLDERDQSMIVLRARPTTVDSLDHRRLIEVPDWVWILPDGRRQHVGKVEWEPYHIPNDRWWLSLS